MSASLLEPNSVDERLLSLTTLVQELRQEVTELRAQVGYWKSMHARAVERNVKLQAELDQAKAEIRQLKAERFGKRSEKQSAADRSNHLEDPQEHKPKRKRGQQPDKPAPKRRDYSHLPVREEFVDLPDEAKVCDACGRPLTDLGHCEDSEQIEIETVIYRRVVHRKRYRRTCGCPDRPHTVAAPLPPKLLPKSLYGTSLWVHLLLEKFHLQRPTQRTIEQLRLLGLNLAPGTIAAGLQRIEPLLTPLYAEIVARQQQSKYFHADESRWRVFVEKAGKVGHRWWLWLFAGEDTVAFLLDPSRSHDVPQSHFARDAQGVLVVDRYSAYKAMPQVKDGLLRLAFCWAHVRRDFVRVGKGFPELKSWALVWLRRIRELYAISRQRLGHAPDSAEFAAADAKLRQHIALLADERDAELADPQLRQPCRKALVSLSEHWSGLTLFVDDPRIPLDNNYGERLIRNPAVGRKNYYGSGAEWAGRLATMLFSIFATLVLWKINPRIWLTWYFEACAAAGGKSPDDAASFLPWNLSPARLAELQDAAPHPAASDTS